MALMNLFAEKEWRCRHREQTADTAGKGRGDELRDSHWHTYSTMQNRQLMGSCHITQGAQLAALGWPEAQRIRLGSGGWRLRRQGVDVHLQLILTVVQQNLSQHWKAIILQLKKKKKKTLETETTIITLKQSFPGSENLFLCLSTSSLFTASSDVDLN